MKFEFLHTSMAGSYYIPCKLLKDIDGKSFLISYHDFIIDEEVTKEVTQEYLKLVSEAP